MTAVGNRIFARPRTLLNTRANSMPGKRKRSCRAGRRVKARKLKLLEEKFLQQVFGPEIVTLDSESDTGTTSREVPLLSYDILDTRSAIKVYNHREVPDKVLVDLFRAFRENEWSCPPSVDEFCGYYSVRSQTPISPCQSR
ncbi:uncharacterized protein LOC143265706 isoform X1 [Megachile rotundata]|uniref:uncharacterized protein LOC143265706 isoform X1 n=1 Tax=Megachile rotundata TaxID=143995 RepID=UPI003FD1469C